MATDKSPIMLILGLIVTITATVTFGLVNIEVLSNTLKPISNWIFVGGFAGVYLLSDREINQLEDYEAVSFLIPVIVAIGMQQIPELQDFVAEYNPIAGFALFGIALMGFYALSTDMQLSIVALEMIFGGTLAITAAIQFGLMEIDVLNNHITSISAWVFLVTLMAAYMISERSIGNMNQIELGAIIVGIGSYFAYEFIPEAQTFIQGSQSRGIVFTLLVVVAYYIIMQNGEVKPDILN